jgi:hypothetical protein
MSRLRKNIEVLDVLEPFWSWLWEWFWEWPGIGEVWGAQSWDIAHRHFLWYHFWTAPSNYFRFIKFSPKLDQTPLECRKKNHNNKKKRKIKFRSTQKSLLQKFVDLFLNKQMCTEIPLNFRSFEISRISQHLIRSTKQNYKGHFFLFYLKFLVSNGLFLSSELREQLLARSSFRPLQIAEESSQKLNSISKSFFWLKNRGKSNKINGFLYSV